VPKQASSVATFSAVNVAMVLTSLHELIL
jgi:hypothetical protein